MAEPVLLFDFDGVFCDSTRECFVVASAARARLAGATDDVADLAPWDVLDDPLLTLFRGYRAYIRWPREYLLLLEHRGGALNQADFDAYEALAPPEAMAFQRAFLATRDALRSRHYERWIRLFDPYQDVVDAAKGLVERYEWRILTGRDAGSVGAVLGSAGLPVGPERIFDVKRFRNKIEGFRAIAAELGADRTYRLIDDNCMHLAALLPEGVEPFWARWGYVAAEHDAAAEAQGWPLIPCQRHDWHLKIQETT